jgi:DNA repair protein RecN (Recombination protein N)
MLTHLSIKGLAVVESLAIDFSDGFNVITGETGAGKSILIKALGLLLGGKASVDTVRQGCEAAVVSGQFVVTKEHSAAKAMAALGIEAQDEDGEVEILIRRQVNRKGRTQAWINDVPIAGSSLKELGATLIDLFAQHDNHRILDPAQHVHYLDQFLPAQSALEEVQELHHKTWATYREICSTVEQYLAQERDRDYLSYRLSEIREFGPEVDDFERNLELVSRGEKAADLSESVTRAQEVLDVGHDGQALSRGLREVAKLLGSIALDEFSTLAAQAANLADGIDELSYEVAKLQPQVEITEAELEAAQDRLGAYRDLMRKFAVSDIHELVGKCQQLAEQYDALENINDVLIERLAEARRSALKLQQVSTDLSHQRVKAAKRVKQVIEKELHELAMPGSALDVDLSKVEKAVPALELTRFSAEVQEAWADIAEVLAHTNEFGQDRCQFLLQSNPGEPVLPLHRIASGGEVSRIMLAVKRALAAGAETCLLVFDEIDTGISGKVADIVGRKIRDLSRDFQVICISHLPQVAAYGDTHYLVSKVVRGGRTESEILPLSVEQRYQEVARMMSGPKITKTSIEHAKELIVRASS